MKTSNVYFADFSASDKENVPAKLARLIKRAGFDSIDFSNKFAAIKIHFGEPGNTSYLRPNFAKVVVDEVKKRGGNPFLTDANTLYVGRRKNALDHIEAAYENGFSPFSTGCHILIADGLKGTDDVMVPVNGEFVKEAMIGRAVMDADIFISLTHFKFHECAGLGGVMKNIGMGCGSRAGKMDMHSDGKPIFNQKICIGCKACARSCGQDAISFVKNKATVNYDQCAGCSRCIGVCPVDAIESSFCNSNDLLNKKIVEYTKAVVQNRPQFHISLIMDVSPYCDCHPANDRPIIPNVGMFASVDPVALDLACAEMLNQQKPIEDSLLGGTKPGTDYFHAIHPTTNWRGAIEHGVKIGLGSDQYKLIKI